MDTKDAVLSWEPLHHSDANLSFTISSIKRLGLDDPEGLASSSATLVGHHLPINPGFITISKITNLLKLTSN